jgi:hypothetical protein
MAFGVKNHTSINLDGTANFGVQSIERPAGDVFMRSVLKPIAWLSLLLMFASAYGFAAHRHSSSLDEAQCTVCVVAHSASAVGTYKLPSTTPALVRLPLPAEPLSAKQRLVPFALTVRPPPAI